ncbi:MAG TPA: hypothetical protein PLS25_03925 [Methanoregulaceae archaeon]|nr:hypothetical protein [Methanoregulaceae archaeon]
MYIVQAPVPETMKPVDISASSKRGELPDWEDELDDEAEEAFCAEGRLFRVVAMPYIPIPMARTPTSVSHGCFAGEKVLRDENPPLS